LAWLICCFILFVQTCKYSTSLLKQIQFFQEHIGASKEPTLFASR
jgi:hypothetical protein